MRQVLCRAGDHCDGEKPESVRACQLPPCNGRCDLIDFTVLTMVHFFLYFDFLINSFILIGGQLLYRDGFCLTST